MNCPTSTRRASANAEGVDDEVEDAVQDHNEIRAAIRKVGRSEPGSGAWWQAVIECRVANNDHLAEEERQDLADFRPHSSLELRHQIAPEEYVAEHAIGPG
ncbi:MAG: hypothetical protein WCG47_15110 [Dermatophilaceae bacterium]